MFELSFVGSESPPRARAGPRGTPCGRPWHDLRRAAGTWSSRQTTPRPHPRPPPTARKPLPSQAAPPTPPARRAGEPAVDADTSAQPGSPPPAQATT